ncbi:MAG TPA: hypothetical protein PLY32_04930 [Salinivirgaceae bacterium]|nr:hypothetical protein [Salinivirgaceae bacterium]HQA76445.1 hypothetical protein [Salinivirgaceae bacterium]
MFKLLVSIYLFSIVSQTSFCNSETSVYDEVVLSYQICTDSIFSNVSAFRSANFPIVLDKDKTILFQQTITYKGIDPEYPIKLNIQFTSVFVDSVWGLPEFRTPYTNKKDHLIIIGSNQTGSVIIFTDEKTRTTLYILQTNKPRNSKPTLIKGFSNGGFPIHSATIDMKGETIVFSSRRVGSVGGYDLFYTIMSDNQNSLSVRNISREINSIYNEIYPQFTQNDSVLLFSSDRKVGFGGFDIYYSSCSITDSWSEALNVGSNINTEKNDVRLFTFDNGEKGIITRRDTSDKLQLNEVIDVKIEFATSNKSIITQSGKNKSDFYPTIKGVVACKPEIKNAKIQVSILDSLGILVGTDVIDSITKVFEVGNNSDKNSYVTISGNEIRTITREIKIPPKYNYPLYIVDFAADTDNKTDNSFDIFFNQNIDIVDNMQLSEFNAWVKETKVSKGDYLISGRRAIKSSKSEIAFERWNYIHKLLTNNEIPDKNISVKKIANFSSTADAINGNLDILPENRIFTIYSSSRAYPEYSVIDISDAKYFRNTSENQKYTIVLSDNLEDVNALQYHKINIVGYTNVWIDNSGRKPRYCLGMFESYWEATIVLSKLSNSNFKHAYIAVYDEHRERIKPIKDGQIPTNQTENQTFYVQIWASAQPIDIFTLPEAENICTIIDSNGIYRYIYPFDNLELARQMQKHLKILGFSGTAILIITK